MLTQQPKQILVAPLDWGLGHTARCIPLIRYIQGQGHHAIVVCNESQRTFIEETFGAIDIIHLDGYNIRYSKWNKLAQVGLISQFPEILKTIKSEHNWLKQLCNERHVDGIISDNRYGLFHPSTPSVILTHQLQVRTGFGNIADGIVQKQHYKYLDRFHETWVVDVPGIPNLGGKLSHPSLYPEHIKYIGLLSRFEIPDKQKPNDGPILILLSGPEPQRSDLSKILWPQAQCYKGNVIFIEGSDSAAPPPDIPDHITYHKRLAGKSLATILENAGIIICRSGYSTLMDLIALQKKAILIPTPGQTEQEYLGGHLHTQGIFCCSKQNRFELNKALQEANRFPYSILTLHDGYNIYKSILDKWIQTL